jgi:DNA-binding CsgD family transcriptional regulator
MGIPTRGRDGSPAVLHVLPLAQRSPRTGAAWKTVAAVFVADTGGQATLPSDAIAVLFDLTPTETRVLEMTLDGHGTREVAERLEVAPSTIKTHMKSLFAKTGQHRREDLIKLARGVSLPG